MYNIYGYTTCGHDAICMAELWRAGGLQRRPGSALGHVITQVFYDGGWHLLDGDKQAIYLLRDNRTVANAWELARDHDLVTRTHADGLLRPDSRAANEWEASIFTYQADAGGERPTLACHTMAMVLRPGEAITWRRPRWRHWRYRL